MLGLHRVEDFADRTVGDPGAAHARLRIHGNPEALLAVGTDLAVSGVIDQQVVLGGEAFPHLVHRGQDVEARGIEQQLGLVVVLAAKQLRDGGGVIHGALQAGVAARRAVAVVADHDGVVAPELDVRGQGTAGCRGRHRRGCAAIGLRDHHEIELGLDPARVHRGNTDQGAARRDIDAGAKYPVGRERGFGTVHPYRLHALRCRHAADQILLARGMPQHGRGPSARRGERRIDQLQHRNRGRQSTARGRDGTGPDLGLERSDLALLLADLRLLRRQLVLEQLHQLPVFLLAIGRCRFELGNLGLVGGTLLIEQRLVRGELLLHIARARLRLAQRLRELARLRTDLRQHLLGVGGRIGLRRQRLFAHLEVGELAFGLSRLLRGFVLLLAQSRRLCIQCAGARGQVAAQLVQAGHIDPSGRASLFQLGSGGLQLALGLLQRSATVVELALEALDLIAQRSRLLLLLFHRLPQTGNLGLLGFHLHLHRRGEDDVIAGDAGGVAIQVERLG
ncbi:MAG: hypothetical protein LKM39_07510 [Chiayiivirga sp.]|nr:hypothetical protein [Chiayiivirga sp.]